jgi:glycosyltransferase involved in cell wall biosynthesis
MSSINVLPLSIITINLNNDDGIKKTIESVIEQTYKNFEFIVIDGGSTDDSINIIKQFSNQISFWVSERDSGIYNAMNKGIKIAKGEYCLFLNSGDFFYSSETLLNIFSLGLSEDIFYGDSFRFDTFIDKGFFIIEPDNLSLYHFFKKSICHQSTFIKRELFNKYGYYNEQLHIAADWEFNIKAIVINDCQTKHINIPVVYYDAHGISNINREKSLKEREVILNQLFPKRVIADLFRLELLENELLMINKSFVFSVQRKFRKTLKVVSFDKVKKIIRALKPNQMKNST